MQCFRVTNTVLVGIPVDVNVDEGGKEYPFVHTPEGSPMRLLLDRELSEYILTKAYTVQLQNVSVSFADGVVLLKRCRKKDTQALVHIGTPAGVGGKVKLTSGSYTSALRGGDAPRVYQQHHPFPDAGVTALCTNQELEAVNRGVDVLDLMVLMHQGARFRIQRTGDLAGASPWVDVRWTGHKLLLKDAESYAEAGLPFPPVAGAAAAAG